MIKQRKEQTFIEALKDEWKVILFIVLYAISSIIIHIQETQNKILGV